MGEETARLRIVQITDVYTLKNFPHLKTLLNEKRAEIDKLGGKTISMLTGDFLAPYLLSSFDKGQGMVNILNKTPIEYVIWGNHEHDLEHEHVMKREKEYKGIWINSNMKSHESFKDSKCQVDRAVIEVTSPDGSNKRKMGMLGVLSDVEGLYKPDAFGGATIDDPWESMKEYNDILKNEDGCDMVLPLCHLYEHQDERTCNEFDFPVILSGHDHHRVDRVVNGTRLLKPGMDGHYAIVMDLVWDSASSDSTPRIDVETIAVADYDPDEELANDVARAYSVLDPLLKTDLTIIPQKYSPLSSRGVRERRTTMATYLCSQFKLALNLDQKKSTRSNCDCVIVKGGNIRAERDYDEYNFTMEGLRSEMQEEECVHIYCVPGHVLKGCMKETWFGPNPGWMQYDDSIDVDEEGNIVSIGGFPLIEFMIYRVGSFQDFNVDWGGQPTLAKYFEENPKGLPDPDAAIGCQVLLLKLFSVEIWKKLLTFLDADGDGEVSTEELKALDIDGDGKLSKAELRAAISKVAGLSTIEGQDALVDYVLSAAGDEDKDGQLSIDEINK